MMDDYNIYSRYFTKKYLCGWFSTISCSQGKESVSAGRDSSMITDGDSIVVGGNTYIYKKTITHPHYYFMSYTAGKIVDCGSTANNSLFIVIPIGIRVFTLIHVVTKIPFTTWLN